MNEKSIKKNVGLTTPTYEGRGHNLDPELDRPSINRDDWTLYDSQGFVEAEGVRVRDYGDQVSINRTLHRSEDLTVSDDGLRIDGKAGWHLQRQGD